MLRAGAERSRASARLRSKIKLGNIQPAEMGSIRPAATDAPDALQVADVVGVLRTEVARVLGLDLAVRLLVLSGLLERPDLVLGEDEAFLGHLRRERLQPLLEGLQVVAQLDGANARG